MENWREKIAQGMKLIKQGCHEQTSWTECKYCPFEDYCDAIEHEELNLPTNWFESGENA